jgi:hypothetical protein
MNKETCTDKTRQYWEYLEHHRNSQRKMRGSWQELNLYMKAVINDVSRTYGRKDCGMKIMQ